MMEFVNWDDDITKIWKKKTCSKPPTRIYLPSNPSILVVRMFTNWTLSCGHHLGKPIFRRPQSHLQVPHQQWLAEIASCCQWFLFGDHPKNASKSTWFVWFGFENGVTPIPVEYHHFPIFSHVLGHFWGSARAFRHTHFFCQKNFGLKWPRGKIGKSNPLEFVRNMVWPVKMTRWLVQPWTWTPYHCQSARYPAKKQILCWWT